MSSFRGAVSHYITDEDMIVPPVSAALQDWNILAGDHPTKNSSHLTMWMLRPAASFQSIIGFFCSDLLSYAPLHLGVLPTGVGHNGVGF